MAQSFNTKDYAIYLPAINTGYANFLTKPIPQGRPFPAGLAIEDFCIWNKNSKLFYHPYLLHSIGNFNALSTVNNSITQAASGDFTLVGDSGGYQIGSGALKGVEGFKKGMSAKAAMAKWRDAHDVRKWIVSWLDTYTNYAMTIDIPLWALDPKQGKNSPFHKCTAQELLDMTIENLKFINLYGRKRTKWLNVIQGIDQQTTIDWWNGVKFFDCSGYAIGAGGEGGLAQVIRTTRMMHEQGYLNAGHDWIHALGVSTPLWAILLTKIQNCLRATNPNLTVSYDSSSPFQNGGKFEKPNHSVPFTNKVSSWSIKTGTTKSVQRFDLIGSKDPFPYNSPLGKVMELGHINVREELFGKKQFDTISNMLLTNHNVWVYLDAFDRANDAVFKDPQQSNVPQKYLDALEVMDEAFVTPNWQTQLTKHKDVLDAVFPSQY
jgi:hypothetical protein